MYVAQQCFGLSDGGLEDDIYDSQAIRGFVGIDLTHESAPDATTLLKFSRLLEKHDLMRRIFDEINGHLDSKGLTMRKESIVDTTLITAPPSTKNRDEKRDPAMHQSKKCKNWFALHATADHRPHGQRDDEGPRQVPGGEGPDYASKPMDSEQLLAQLGGAGSRGMENR